MRPADAVRLTLLAAIWGSSFLMIKVSLETLSPLQIVAIRLVIGACVLVLLLRVNGGALPRHANVWIALTFMAVFSNIVPFSLIAWGEERISSGLTSILNSTTPLFTAAIAAMFLPQERPSAARWFGVVVGFTGVIVIVGLEPEGGRLIGELAVTAGSLSYGVTFVFAKRFLSKASMDQLSTPAAQLIVASLLMVPVAGLDTVVHAPAFPPTTLLAMGVLGAFGTGFAYVLYYRLIHDVGATTASFVTYLIPVFGVTIGWLALGERLGWNAIAGAALVIAGIALAERARRRTPAEAVERSQEVSVVHHRVGEGR